MLVAKPLLVAIGFLLYFLFFILYTIEDSVNLHFTTDSYISLLIIPCMIVYVTNNKEPWTRNCLVTNILQSILFCAQQKLMEQYEESKLWQNFHNYF